MWGDRASAMSDVFVSPALQLLAREIISGLRAHAAAAPPALSARAYAALLHGAKALAMMRRKRFVVPAHLCSVACLVLRHRIGVRAEFARRFDAPQDGGAACVASHVIDEVVQRLDMPP